jgi:phosphoribosylanthranilate isomerase
MKLQTKVCGMRHADNISEVAALRPNWLGFIFYPSSQRYVGEDFVMPPLPPDVARVGVFVGQSYGDIQRLVTRHNLQAVQLHGAESPDHSTDVRALGVTVIKAFSVHDHFNFEEVEPYHNRVDYFLFDTRGKTPGGTGMQFNWDLLEHYDQQTPFFLSGGLGLNELDQLHRLAGMNLAGVDLNSRLEDSPGLKNPEAVRLALVKISNLTV